ncbi:SusC/RagA family TonB-linked outer membrane protein [Fulvivirga sediminis]|uniref:TonB-dependent receptor n=1 Tax=Fulvivirga sediminis TaxID=2803949 RepID=A0A937F3T6_9BACT|nr:TonB-dependent receptor [Fulvivirga sediminis]MBL3655836.1 TonB-dependent receptor [Fulvivirga sediminis]
MRLILLEKTGGLCRLVCGLVLFAITLSSYDSFAKDSAMNYQTERLLLKGTVLDEFGDPLPGATIIESGTQNGTITDVDGQFQIRVPEGAVINISFVGYSVQEIPVGSQTQISVTLEPDVESLEEVVVVGYGTQKKENVTGAVSTVKSKELTRSTSTTTAGALAGRVQGVTVRAKDARPGKGAAIEIRNMGNPLYVIDGIAYGGQSGSDWLNSSNVSGADMFNSLNMEDIESISILKDASAAIYGLRASNGVVLVTTKKGKKGTPRVNINGYYGWQNLTRFPDLANAAAYTRGQVEAAQNEGIDPYSIYTPEELAKWQAGTEPGYKSYDYYDLTMRKNIPQYSLNANVSGGSENSNYYLSIGNTSQQALMEDFDYKRTNIQANMETNLSRRFKIGSQISARHEKTEDVGLPGGDGYFSAILGMLSNIPTVGPYANDNPNYVNHTRDFSRNPALFSRDKVGYKDNINRNANINLYAKYAFDFGLSAKATVSYNYTHNNFDGFQYTYDVYTYDPVEDTYNATAGSDAGWRYQSEREVVARYGQFQLDYEKELGNHLFSVMVGYERSDYDKNYLMVGTVPSNNYLPLLEFDKMNGFGDQWSYEARAGYVGRINYNYDDRYLVELLGRYDGSYLYPKGHRWGFFPGVSLAWRVSNEAFFEGMKKYISSLKLRVSSGQTGKEQGVDMFGYLAGYNWNSGNAVLDGKYYTGIQPKGLPVTQLTWVKNRTSNIGIDAGFFDDKLKLTADVFQIRRTGVPAPRYDVLLPSEVGYTLPNENLNKDGYNGAEGSITYSSSVGEVSYHVGVNATYSRYRNIYTYKQRYGNSWDEYKNSNIDRVGGTWWGYQVVGRFQSEEEIRNYQIDNDGNNNSTQLPGDFIYKDVNGDGVINSLDERPIGYPNNWSPMLSFGGNLGAEWKGFGLNIDLVGGAMQSWFQDYELRNAFHAGGNSPAYLLEDRWHRADPYDPNSEWIPGYYPALRNGKSGPNSRNSDFWLTNVKYLRIRNIELGYTFPSEITSKMKMQNLRVYANVSNLISFDNVKKFQIDPEIEANAAVVYPQQRTVVVGFNLTL